MKLVTGNVNSLTVRFPQVLDWIGRPRPDVLCLQEVKLENERTIDIEPRRNERPSDHAPVIAELNLK